MKPDFDKSFERTMENEGPYQAMAGDSGNWYPGPGGTLMGTSYGITPVFVKDRLKLTPTKAFMQSITFEKAREIYRNTIWKMMRGDEWNILGNYPQAHVQSLCDLVFDWMVQRYGTCIGKMGEVFYLSSSNIAAMKNTLKLSDLLLQGLNVSAPDVVFWLVYEARYNHIMYSNVYGQYKDGVLNRLRTYSEDLPAISCEVHGIGRPVTKQDICDPPAPVTEVAEPLKIALYIIGGAVLVKKLILNRA